MALVLGRTSWHNDSGFVDRLNKRNAFEAQARAKCDHDHPVAKKLKGTVGGKPWTNCYNDAMARYDEGAEQEAYMQKLKEAQEMDTKNAEDEQKRKIAILDAQEKTLAAANKKNADSPSSTSIASSSSAGGINPSVVYIGVGMSVLIIIVVAVGVLMAKNSSAE